MYDLLILGKPPNPRCLRVQDEDSYQTDGIDVLLNNAYKHSS